MAEVGSAEKLKVFISYSRRDSSDFADELLTGLELAGFAPFLDRHDIAPGEPWEERLGGLIQEADTVVYVISPEAVKSERCGWEVERTLALSKRLLPVVFKPVPELDIPEQLRRRQFVRFDLGSGITRPLAQLADALRHDLDWVREHTRLGELAQRWEARGRPESLLLRGDELVAAQAWADARKSNAPAISEVVGAYLAASKRVEVALLARESASQRRNVRMRALLFCAVAVVIIVVIGWINQSLLATQWRWWSTERPFIAANIWPYLPSAEQEGALKAGASFRECSARSEHADLCPDMVVLPAGSFMMGTLNPGYGYSNEKPLHRVTIAKLFAVSKFEVTFDEWDSCVHFRACDANGASDAGWGRGQRPVIYVTWDDAQQYAAWLSKVTGKAYRLLSEAEYEYAARGGKQTVYPWGNELPNNNANCTDCGSQWGGKQTAPVGSFPPNNFGLYDMVGNVFEWVEDCYHPNYENAPTDGSSWTTGDCSDRVIRGGSWDLPPGANRSAIRLGVSAGLRTKNMGFRVARTLNQ